MVGLLSHCLYLFPVSKTVWGLIENVERVCSGIYKTFAGFYSSEFITNSNILLIVASISGRFVFTTFLYIDSLLLNIMLQQGIHILTKIHTDIHVTVFGLLATGYGTKYADAGDTIKSPRSCLYSLNSFRYSCFIFIIKIFL